MLLRTRWAMGAADWMSGGNDSKENDKELFNYSDEEWSYIWTTMLEDGAWTVPSIKDTFGNNIKENHAPEIFIKYIAHDLKCHILIFDLMLGQKTENSPKVTKVTIHNCIQHNTPCRILIKITSS